MLGWWNIMFLTAAAIWILAIKLTEPLDDEQDRRDIERAETRRRNKMDKLLSQQVYKSDRYVLIGNIGYRITCTDLHEDKGYEIKYGDLVKFRTYWDKIADNKKDVFITTIIANLKGETNKIHMVARHLKLEQFK